jgi:hypothetical protein
MAGMQFRSFVTANLSCALGTPNGDRAVDLSALLGLKIKLQYRVHRADVTASIDYRNRALVF